jgi:hypothetical protein
MHDFFCSKVKFPFYNNFSLKIIEYILGVIGFFEFNSFVKLKRVLLFQKGIIFI